MSNKHKKFCTTLNCIEHFLSLASSVTGRILISNFSSFLGIPIEIASSALGLKICAITAGIKRYKSIVLGKSKLNNTKILISKALTDSSISLNDELLLKNDLIKCGNMKEEIKN